MISASREIHSINLYRNGYENALNTFKRIKVEVSSNEDFVRRERAVRHRRVEETAATKLAAQTINLTTPVTARYVRIWQKGHCIQNTNSSWEGIRNGVGLREIEVIAKLKDGETLPDAQETRNIALGKLPYVYGLDPTNIAAISDGKQDDNYAVHNSTGERWLQFEYRTATVSTRAQAGHLSAGPHRRVVDAHVGRQGRRRHAFATDVPDSGDAGRRRLGRRRRLHEAGHEAGQQFPRRLGARVPTEGQPVTRFDDLYGAESGAYRIAPASRTEGLTAVSNGDAAWQNKNNFYYGGQPRYETSRSHAVPLMQGRFALRLRATTLCRIRANAFTRSERPVAGKVVPPNRRNRAAP